MLSSQRACKSSEGEQINEENVLWREIQKGRFRNVSDVLDNERMFLESTVVCSVLCIHCQLFFRQYLRLDRHLSPYTIAALMYF